MTRSKVFAAILVVQLVFVYWALDVPGLVRGDESPAFVPARIAPSGTPIDIELGQRIASQHARGWSPDARLIAMSMRLEWPANAVASGSIALPEGGWLIFTFADGDRTLSVYLDRRSGVYITSNQSAFGDDALPAIDLAGYARGSTTAALTAEVLHGASYRAACPATRTSALVTPSRIVASGGVATPVWTVTYADSRFPGDIDVLVQVDALSGNVIKSDAFERPCAA